VALAPALGRTSGWELGKLYEIPTMALIRVTERHAGSFPVDNQLRYTFLMPAFLYAGSL
jgi:hypothetical protein